MPTKDQSFLKHAKNHVIKKMGESEGSDSYYAAMVCLASVYVGPNIKRISKLLRVPRRWVAKYSKNLRNNKVWVGNRVYGDWLNKKDGGISFCCDVCVAAGLLDRA